jgi:hypothetical protein
MSCTVKDIYALRESSRNVLIPGAIAKSIEIVKKSIEKSGGNVQTKPMEWRNSKPKTEHNQNAFSGQSSHKKVFKSDDIAPHKYVSKFKKTSVDIDDTILNTILRGKLNKFSLSNYNEIKEFITHIIDGGQTDMIKCFMKLVFEKAASEEIFCPLYAKLISELSIAYPILLSEMENLYTQYLQIFDSVTDNQSEDYDELCQRNIEKKYRRGYSQFLAELIKNNVMNTEIFMKIIYKIIGQVETEMTNKDSIKLIEEFADCLMKIVKAISTSEYQQVKNMRMLLKNETNSRIHPLSMRTEGGVGLSNKSRFTFLDIYEAIIAF